jgi:hypothetical protein
MVMKHCIGILLFFIVGSLSAQDIVKMSAVKANNYGVTYSLPKTSVNVTVEYTKTVKKAGQFYQYAERYLNITNPIVEDEVVYTLDKIDVNTTGIVDRDKSYQMEFKSNSVSPFVSLTKDGLICAINSDYTFHSVMDDSGIFNEHTPLPIDPTSYFSEEILRAGSTAKQAELIAKRIYSLRESRNNILTGEADNMPPDGDAYKLVMSQIDDQEKALTSLFAGSELKERGSMKFTVIPDDKNIENKILFRFSSKLGVVGSDDLSGAPVYFTLINKNPKQEVFLTPKEEKDLEKKFSKGVIYNVPGKGSLQVVYNNKTYINKEYDIVQYGTQDVLTPQMIDNNKQPVKVIFYPDLGAIKEIK